MGLSAKAGEVFEDDVLVIVGGSGTGSFGGTRFARTSTRSWVHQFEGNIGHQFAAHGAHVALDAGHVADDETGGTDVLGCGCRRGQVHFIVFEETVESDAADVLVAVEAGRQREGFGERSSRGDGAALAGLEVGHALVVVTVDQSDFHVLHHGHRESFDGLLGLVFDVDVEADLLVVVEHFPVERQLHIQFAAGEGEALADHRARLFGADRHRSELNLQRPQYDNYPSLIPSRNFQYSF